MSKFQLNPLRLSCLVELGTGTALLLAPGLAMTLIVGSSLPNGGNQMAQLFGAAILCLGLSCWSSNASSERTSMPTIGLTAYNVIAGVLLTLFSINGVANAIVAIPAALLHIALGVVLFVDQRKGLR